MSNKSMMLRIQKLKRHAEIQWYNANLHVRLQWGKMFIYPFDVASEIKECFKLNKVSEATQLCYYVLDRNLNFIKNIDGFEFIFSEQEKILYGEEII